MNTASSLHLGRLRYVVYQRNSESNISRISCLSNRAYYIWGKRTLRRMEL